jgi:hypothetical protein
VEKRALQTTIILAGFVPVIGGALGCAEGQLAFGPWAGAGEDSHMRYLSGLLLAIGLAFWGCVPAVERRGDTVRLLTLIVVVGGLARLGGLFVHGDPGVMRWALGMELAVTPGICVWQASLARRLKSSGDHPVSSRLRP